MSAVLYYFNGRGRAETIRLTMAVTGVKWSEISFTEKESYERIKTSGKLLFNQLPLVEYQGKNMVQSGSIARYFARKGGLLGLTNDETFKIDSLYEGTRDFILPFMNYGFNGFQEVLDEAKATVLPRYLPIYEKELVRNGANGYLVGNKQTLADIGLLEVLLTIDELMGPQELEPYPNMQKALLKNKSIPTISAYLNGPLRHIANDEKYVNEIKNILNF